MINEAGDTVTAPRGASDAFLTPYHVERSKIFVNHRLRLSEHLDADRIARAIELTRFPVPEDDDHADTHTEAGLLRAADLIGQLADPHYPRKLNALFHEFVETGVAERLDFKSPADLAERYPRFFWSVVEPYIRPALQHLQRTVEGKQWIAQLYAHVFVEEHVRARAGPQRGVGEPVPDHAKVPLTPIAGAAAPSPDDARVARLARPAVIDAPATGRQVESQCHESEQTSRRSPRTAGLPQRRRRRQQRPARTQAGAAVDRTRAPSCPAPALLQQAGGEPAERARRLPHARCQGRGALRRQGQVAAQAGPGLCQARRAQRPPAAHGER